MSGGGYRDDLAAAHARIAELEEKVRLLEKEEERPSQRVSVGRFPELEAKVAELRAATDPLKIKRRRAVLTFVGAFLPMIGMALTAYNLTILAVLCSVVFLSIVAAGFFLTDSERENIRQWKAAEAKLADAQRIADLEKKLANSRARIGAPESPLPIGEADSADDVAASRTKTAG